MVFVLDVGNTQTTVALFEGKKLRHSWRLSTARHRTSDEWAGLLQSLFHLHSISLSDMEGIVISSVVPPADWPLRQMSQRHFGLEPIFVAPGIKTGIHILYDNPAEVGADRIVNAVATYARYEAPAIVVDFGTATTFDMLGEDGNYLGGVIAPGLGISAEALFEKAARLPKVEIARPRKVIGKSTVTSMQSGLYWGYVALVEGTLKRMKKEFGPVRSVIATGGLAPVLARDCPSIETVDENLTLEGLRLLWEKNKKT
jgi:type III pantothenate kinase